MKKRLFAKCKTWVLTVGVLYSLPLTGQAQVPTINWDVTIGGKEKDVLNSFALTEDKGYIAGGTSTSGKSGEKGDESRGKEDYWVVKLDDRGRVEWERTYGGEDKDELGSVRPVKGGYIVGGTSLSNSGKGVEKEQDSKGGSDYWVLKLNERGDIEWQRTIGGDKDDQLAIVLETRDGGYIVGGTSASPKSGDKSEDTKGVDPRTGDGSDYWVVKLNSKGDIEWDRTIGGVAYAMLTDMLVVDEGYILGGYALPGKGNDKSEEGFKSYDFWIVKINERGDLMWDKVYGGDGNDQLTAMVAIEKDGFAIAGNSDSEPSGNKKDKPVKGTDYWMVKLNNEGDYEWDRVIGSEGSDYLVSIAAVERSFLLGGTSDGDRSGHKTEDKRAANMHDYWSVKIDEKGAVEWDKTMGGDRNELGGILYPTPDAGYIVAGSSNSDRKFEKTDGNRGDFDYWIIKLIGCTPTKTTENRQFCAGAGYTLPDGRVVKSAGTYTSIVKGKTGCDDTTVTILAEMPVYETVIYDTICAGTDYTLPDGRIVRNDGFFRCSFRTVANCDSVIVVSLSLKTIDTAYVSTAICAGGSYTLPGGRVVTDEGVYVDTFVTADGCDSVIVTSLSQDGIDTGVTVFSDELSANSADGTYEWIDCATNQPIPGATNRNYVPTESGEYAVKISLNGCVATSDCYEVELPTGVADMAANPGIRLYPNPAKGHFTVDAGALGAIEQLALINTMGATVYQLNPGQAVCHVPVSELPAGMYMIQIQTAAGVSSLKVQLLP